VAAQRETARSFCCENPFVHPFTAGPLISSSRPQPWRFQSVAMTKPSAGRSARERTSSGCLGGLHTYTPKLIGAR